MLLSEKEIGNIETVGDLRAALADVPDTVEIGDVFREGLLLSLRGGPGTDTIYYIEVS